VEPTGIDPLRLIERDHYERTRPSRSGTRSSRKRTPGEEEN
jgi:hypothetical protein